MRFEDEQFVKLYTRDTPTWKMLTWQGKACLPLILRKLDRCGMMELGKRGVTALAALIEIPIEIVESGMSDLIENDVLSLNQDGILLMARFLEGQETRQSDRARQRASRERARDTAKYASSPSITSQPVTRRHTASHGVTECHGSSPGVTSGHPASPTVTLRLDETRLDKNTPRPKAASPGTAEPGNQETFFAEEPKAVKGPTDHQKLIGHFIDAFVSVRGCRPEVTSREGKGAKVLLAAVGFPAATAIVTAAFEDQFYRDNQASLDYLASNPNRYLGKKTKPKPGPPTQLMPNPSRDLGAK